MVEGGVGELCIKVMVICEPLPERWLEWMKEKNKAIEEKDWETVIFHLNLLALVCLCGVPSRKLALRVRPHRQTLPMGGARAAGGCAMAIFLANAMSISMLPPQGATVRISPITVGEVRALLAEGFQSAVGHPSTAQVLSTLLGVEVPPNRVSISLQVGDTLVVFQLGVRLEEGKILSSEEVATLYREGKATFYKVEVLDQ